MIQPTFNPPAEGNVTQQLDALASVLATIAIRIATKGVQSEPVKKVA